MSRGGDVTCTGGAGAGPGSLRDCEAGTHPLRVPRTLDGSPWERRAPNEENRNTGKRTKTPSGHGEGEKIDGNSLPPFFRASGRTRNGSSSFLPEE